jgi:hypothetical protein
MDMVVRLSQIVEGMEFHSDQATFYLNTQTGKVILITPDDTFAGDEDDPIESYPDWQQEGVEAARSLARGNDANLLPLPDRWEINEYQIMEDFCLSLPAGKKRNELCDSIKGRGAFRRFKDTLQGADLFKDWNQYRTSRLKTMAADWCKANEVAFEDDMIL